MQTCNHSFSEINYLSMNKEDAIKRERLLGIAVGLAAFAAGLAAGLLYGRHGSEGEIDEAKKLASDLKKAVNEERYEDAVVLRDKILALKNNS